MEKVISLGRFRTTINGLGESITLSADAPLTLTIRENEFKFSIPKATPQSSGFMSSLDKAKLDTVSYNATDNIGTLTSVRINGLELTNSGPVDIPIANINQFGVTRLSNSTASESEETAATSKAVKAVWDMAELKTANRGTITEIIMNGESLGDYGIVDLGTVVREHQSIDHKVDKVPGKGLSTNDFTDEYLSLVETALQEHQDVSHKVDDVLIGAPNGLATLDSEGKVPGSQLRSYYINVIEAQTKEAFPEVGEPQKIYIATGSRLIYRWNGTEYEELSVSLELGETNITAYRGDRGRAAYNHSLVQSGNPHRVTKEEIGLGNVPNVTTNNQIPTYETSDSLSPLISGEILATTLSKLAKVTTTVIDDTTSLRNHLQNVSNPHQVTNQQVGLGNVKNIDQSKAINSLTKIGSRIEYTQLDGSSGSIQISGSDDGSRLSTAFEWLDGNIHNEDRSGLFVTLEGDKIQLAQEDSAYVAGIVISEDNSSQWAQIAMFGKTVCIDDNSAEVNGYVTSGTNGIATKSDRETKYRVINRIDDSHITVLIN